MHQRHLVEGALEVDQDRDLVNSALVQELADPQHRVLAERVELVPAPNLLILHQVVDR